MSALVSTSDHTYD